MSDVVDFLPSRDPLLRDAPLDYTLTLPVLGIETEFASNSRFVIALVEEAFGGWKVVRAENADAPKRVRIVVFDDDLAANVRHVSPDATRVIGFSAGVFGLSDPDRNEAIIYASRHVVANGEQFRDTMLEAMTLALLAHFDRHPIHASAIARNGRAVLLAGESGSGKSTLAHLAHSSGFDVLSEDTVRIQLAPTMRVWGWPGYARLISGNDGDKTRVALDRNPACYVADGATVCLLERGIDAGLTRASSDEVLRALTTSIAPGFDRFAERHAAVARWLASGGGWRLTLSRNPSDALPFLEQMLSER